MLLSFCPHLALQVGGNSCFQANSDHMLTCTTASAGHYVTDGIVLSCDAFANCEASGTVCVGDGSHMLRCVTPKTDYYVIAETGVVAALTCIKPSHGPDSANPSYNLNIVTQNTLAAPGFADNPVGGIRCTYGYAGSPSAVKCVCPTDPCQSAQAPYGLAGCTACTLGRHQNQYDLADCKGQILRCAAPCVTPRTILYAIGAQSRHHGCRA